jgi:hypothetical protein
MKVFLTRAELMFRGSSVRALAGISHKGLDALALGEN